MSTTNIYTITEYINSTSNLLNIKNYLNNLSDKILIKLANHLYYDDYEEYTLRDRNVLIDSITTRNIDVDISGKHVYSSVLFIPQLRSNVVMNGKNIVLTDYADLHFDTGYGELGKVFENISEQIGLFMIILDNIDESGLKINEYYEDFRYNLYDYLREEIFGYFDQSPPLKLMEVKILLEDNIWYSLPEEIIYKKILNRLDEIIENQDYIKNKYHWLFN